MQMKATSLENRLDRMMQDMDNVQKIMNQANDDDHEVVDDDGDGDSSSSDQYEDPANDFNDNSISGVEEALNKAVQLLNSDLNHLKDRVSCLELAAQQSSPPPAKKSGFLSELSGQTTAFVIIWPFAAFALLKLCNK